MGVLALFFMVFAPLVGLKGFVLGGKPSNCRQAPMHPRISGASVLPRDKAPLLSPHPVPGGPRSGGGMNEWL